MVIFFFKQNTAYEMRISDWSSDVCSSDLVDYAQPEGTSYTELSGNYRQPLFGGAFRANGLFKSSQMFADVRHDITYPAPALILATERNNTRAPEAQVGYDRRIGASSQLELLAIRRNNPHHALHNSTRGGPIGRTACRGREGPGV